MGSRQIARRYTKALYGLGLETRTLDKLEEDFLLIKKTVDESKDLQVFLRSPVINSDKKASALNEMFKGKISDTTIKLINLLSSKGREDSLYDIAVDFDNIINEQKGIAEVTITTAVKISETEKKSLLEGLKKRLNKDLVPSFKVNKEIKGGFIAQINDTIIDASISHQLENLRKQLMGGSFNN